MIRLERVTRTVTSGTEQLTILDAVDLFVPAGQFIAVTGASGSGKSTLLSLVAGLDAPTSGEVYLAQQRITRMPEDALADLRGAMVGIIFQSFHLIPSLTAYENVLVPMELANQADGRHGRRGRHLGRDRAQAAGGSQGTVELVSKPLLREGGHHLRRGRHEKPALHGHSANGGLPPDYMVRF
jgi:predicted ABC-type transport system involved in lysophospholipase L1 biosynthesis ATPase subunit